MLSSAIVLSHAWGEALPLRTAAKTVFLAFPREFVEKVGTRGKREMRGIPILHVYSIFLILSSPLLILVISYSC